MINSLCVIGVGLIGGSLALSLREKQWCKSIVGIDASQQALDEALELNVIDVGYTSIEQCPQVPDVIVIAVPVLRVKEVFMQLQQWHGQCKAITDVCSTKRSIIDAYNEVFDSDDTSCFVPGHPIAGRECSGVTSAVTDLYEQRKVILTPMENTSAESLSLVSDMWLQVGAHVEKISADEHDKILAATMAAGAEMIEAKER